MSLAEFNTLKQYYTSLGLEVVKGTKLQYLQNLRPIIDSFVEQGLSELLPGKTLQEIESVYCEVTGEAPIQVTKEVSTSKVLSPTTQWVTNSPSANRLGIYLEEVGTTTTKIPVYYCTYPRPVYDPAKGAAVYLRALHDLVKVKYIDAPITKVVTKAALSNRSFSGSPELGVLAPPEYHADYNRDYTLPLSFERLNVIDLGRHIGGSPAYSKPNNKDRKTKSVVVTPVSKKTKNKINWGTSSVGTYGASSKSSISAIKQNVSLSISTQSRWYINPIGQRYCWRIKDDLIYQVYESGVHGFEFRATYIDDDCVDWIPVPVNFVWNNSEYHNQIKQQLRDLFPHQQQTTYKESGISREREALIRPVVEGLDEIVLEKTKLQPKKIQIISAQSLAKQAGNDARKNKVLAKKYPQKQKVK